MTQAQLAQGSSPLLAVRGVSVVFGASRIALTLLLTSVGAIFAPTTHPAATEVPGHVV